MQAIVTKYLPATNTRGARIKAKACGGSIIISYDYALSEEDNQRQAAMALAAKYDWPVDNWISGGVDGIGYVFVRAF